MFKSFPNNLKFSNVVGMGKLTYKKESDLILSYLQKIEVLEFVSNFQSRSKEAPIGSKKSKKSFITMGYFAI